MTVPRSSERGGMLVYIFIMAGIFVALSYAVSESFKFNEGSGRAVNEEKMRLVLTEIQDVVEQHRIALHLMLTNGVSISNLSPLYEESVGEYYPSHSTCGYADMTCRLYAPGNGGLQWYKFTELHPDLTDIPNEIDQYFAPNGLYFSAVSGRGTTHADLVYNVRVTKDFCNFINKTLGVTTADIDTTENVSIITRQRLMDATSWDFSVANNAAFTSPGQGAHLQGKTQGCYRDLGAALPSGGNGTGYFYYALVKAY